MNDKKLFIDFGSTFTKVICVCLSTNRIISRAKHPSTVDTDVTEGLMRCLDQMAKDIGVSGIDSSDALACSSAAGGLRIVSIGFVPDYSSEAARVAALGAGAKVVGSYSYEITPMEIEEVRDNRPDIILLTGGTDGGDKKVILHNATMLASCGWPDTDIIVAGNKSAHDEIAALFHGQEGLHFTSNVMPEINRLDVEPCNRVIRDIFINRIIEAKGIGKARALIKNVLMPTPSAILEAARLLAEGYGNNEGLGELLLVDVGGATTDVHSIAEGRQDKGEAIKTGLPLPCAMRTVEADLGLKYNLDRLLEIARERGGGLQGMDRIASRFAYPGHLPEGKDEIDCHTFLTGLALEVAVERHVGRIEARYGPVGEMLLQYGKDLTGVRCVIGTGGPIVYSRTPLKILAVTCYDENLPHILKPKSPSLYLDAEYVLFAGGLLSTIDKERALDFMKKHLVRLR